MALLQLITDVLPHPLLVLPLIIIVLWLGRNRYGAGLTKIPGPFLASFSNLWLGWYCHSGGAVNVIELHKKYNSKLVRLGPSTVSVSDAEAMRVIYGYKPTWKKSSFYIAQMVPDGKGGMISTIASTMDEDYHGRIRRPIANAFSMSSIVGYEPLVDKTKDTFLEEMGHRFIDTGNECPLSEWLQMFAFDVTGQILFDKDFGFLRGGKDIDGMMKNTGLAVEYPLVMGHFPVLDQIIRVKNPFRRPSARGKIIEWVRDQIRQHQENPQTSQDFTDMMNRFVAAQEKAPDVINESRLVDYARTMVAAGSDTTAISLRDLVFNVSTRPKVQEKLLEEIRSVLDARGAEDSRDAAISWKEANNMPYLQACIKESLRCHPAVGQILPRVVPKGGAEICGTYIPEGTSVGCNAYATHKDTSVFGQDVDAWRPERWLESTESARHMENHLFTFGAGPRVCLGRNLAMLELSKFIPELFRRLEVTLVDPQRYHDIPGLLVVQRGLDARLRRRDIL